MIQLTSIKAKKKIQPKIGSITWAVFDLLVARGATGATDQELEALMNMDGNTIRPTRGALVKTGIVKDSGRRRLNAKGNECIVWVATESEVNPTVHTFKFSDFAYSVSELDEEEWENE